MASRPSPNSLIHCAVCGEDYSATYKRCPFCGAKNMPAPAPAPRRAPEPEPDPEPAPSRRPPDPDDTYVFDGQDLFDEEPEDDYRPVRPRGGKRLAEKPSSSPFASADINWPRMITFLCSLIIIVAALVIVFTVIYPQLRGEKDPNAAGTDAPSPAVTDPVGEPTQPADPSNTDPVGIATEPPVTPATEPPLVGPGDDEPTGLTLNIYDFTLNPTSPPVQLIPTVTPADWAGTVTYESSDTSLMTVSATGLVSHANPNMTGGVRRTVVTVRAGSLEAECVVYIAGGSAQATEPPVTQTDPPAVSTQAPSTGGNVTVGRQGVIVGADSGLRVRSGPGTTYSVLATLLNGNSITVVEDAGGGWYKITFSGIGGAATEGYIMGEYISTN